MRRSLTLALALLAGAWAAVPPARAGDPGAEPVPPALAELVAALPAEAGAIGSVALLPIRVSGDPPHAIARPWVSDTDALELALRQALAARYRVVAVREIAGAPHRAELRALSRFPADPAPAARLNRALGTGAVVAARVRTADGTRFLTRAPVLELELRMWVGTEAGSLRPLAARAQLRDAEGRFATWNPVLLASFGVGLLALRGRPAGRDVARAARIRARSGRVVASSGDVDLPIPLG